MNSNNKSKEQFYKISISGINSQEICKNENDCREAVLVIGRATKHNNLISTLVYCVSPSHLNLIIRSQDQISVQKYINDISIEYNKYYSQKHNNDIDIIDEKSAKVKQITKSELLNLSRKIHTNSENWKDCEFSSLRGYIYDDAEEWLDRSILRKVLGSAQQYYDSLDIA